MKIFLSTVFTLAINMVFYLMFAFIKMEINPMLWGEDMRAFLVFMWSVVLFLYLMWLVNEEF